MKKKIATITVGHSPRNDIVPELEMISDNRYKFVQGGGLDGLNEEEVLDMQNSIDGEYLITKINTGKMVKVPRDETVKRMGDCFDSCFKDGAAAGIILCTLESFEELNSNKVIIKPQELMVNYMKSIAKNKKIGVVFPALDVIDIAEKNWAEVSSDVTIEIYSAKEPIENLLSIIKEFSEEDIEVIVLDCIGYTFEMKERIKEICDIPVVLPRTLIISALDELF